MPKSKSAAPIHIDFGESLGENTIFVNDKNFVVNMVESTFQSRCHVHHFFETEILLEGKAEIEIDNTRFIAERGCCWFCLPGTIHTVTFLEKPKLLSIKFDESTIGSALNGYVVAKNNFFIADFCSDEIAKIYGAFTLALETAKKSEELSRLALKGFLQFLSALIIEKNSDRATYIKPEINSTVLKAIVYTKLHIAESITVKQVSEKFGYTPNYFSKLFKRELGKNYNSFLTEERLRIANIMLKNSDLSISEISKQTGFETSAYFCRVYKKVFGKTPTQFKTV